MENSKNKQFISFKLCTILSSVKNSHTILLRATWAVNQPFVIMSMPHALPASGYSVALSVARLALGVEQCLH